jgi:hypothetical protein
MGAPGTLAGQLPNGTDFVPRKLADLERSQKEGLASIADSFNTTVAALNVAIAAVATAAANQVAPGIGAGSTSGFTLTSSSTALVSFNMVVPTGYTRALVTASGSVGSLSTYASADAVHATATIAGSSGPEGVSYFYAPNSGGSATCFQNVSLTGLTGGANILVSLAAHLTTGPGPTGGLASLAVASLMAQAIFLK